MHAARNFLNLHSSCDYTVTSSLDICQVVPLLLSKFFLYSSWMPLHIIQLIHFLNSNLILHMNVKFLEYHMSVFCLHLSGKLPSSFVILNFLFLLLSTYTFFYTFYFTYMCFLTSSFLYMCLLNVEFLQDDLGFLPVLGCHFLFLFHDGQHTLTQFCDSVLVFKVVRVL